MTPGSGATEVVVPVPWVSVIPSEQVRSLDQPRLAWVRLESEQNITIPGPRGSGRNIHQNREVKFQAGKKGGSVPLPAGPGPVLRLEAKGVD